MRLTEERNRLMWTTRLAARLTAAALIGTIGLLGGGAGVVAAADASSTSSNNLVDLQVMVQPGATASGASFTDIITVENAGQGPARDVAITVPFDPAAVQLLGVQFSQPDAWVTTVMGNSFHSDLGRIGSHGQEVQISASFAALPGSTPANALPTSITYSYSDQGKTHSGTTSTELLPTVAAPIAQPSSVGTTVATNSMMSVNSAIFAPGEPVAFWYNAPDGQVLPLYIHKGQITADQQHQERLADGKTHDVNNGHTLNADAQGMIATVLSTKNLDPGAYTLVAHGLNSDATAVIAFQVQ
jgi:hypothetical protein